MEQILLDLNAAVLALVVAAAGPVAAVTAPFEFTVERTAELKQLLPLSVLELVSTLLQQFTLPFSAVETWLRRFLPLGGP